MSLDIRTIDDSIAVAPQIAPADLRALADAGFVAVVNNRPDGEEPGQPSGDAIAEAARAAGLAYAAIPVTGAGFSHPQIDAMIDVLQGVEGPVLAYCRSGTRSCNLWALTQAKLGRAPDEIVAGGAGAGYNLEGLRPMLEALSGRS